MIDIGKKLPNVTFKDKSCFGVIFAHFSGKEPKSNHSAVRTLPQTTGKRIGDERPVEKRIELSVNRVMKQSISHTCFVNITRLGISNLEMLIRTVPIRAIA